MRILSLGDSYTIGEGVLPAERWPVQLARALQSTTGPRIIARTGWTTADLAHAIEQEDPRGPFDLVTLLVGVNNQYQGRDVGEYREQFRALLAQAVAFAGGDPRRVTVLSIPDWGVTPFAVGRDRAKIAREIDAFNQANREETAALQTRYVDITPVSRALGALPGYLADDGLHPSGKMYAEWVKLIPHHRG